ncbi:retrovirus-related pol polyprotein from transposon TNT 1-94 [Tanacetum coccineum]
MIVETNHRSEFDKLQFRSFCEQHVMSYNLSGPLTSQTSEIVKRIHRKLRKMIRAMLDEQSIRQKFWCHALDASFPEPESSPLVEDDRIIEPIIQNPIRSPSLGSIASEPGYPQSVKEVRGHLIEQVINELNKRTLSSKTKQP